MTIFYAFLQPCKTSKSREKRDEKSKERKRWVREREVASEAQSAGRLCDRCQDDRHAHATHRSVRDSLILGAGNTYPSGIKPSINLPIETTKFEVQVHGEKKSLGVSRKLAC